MAIIVSFPGTVGYERNAHAVWGPLRICVVPILTTRNLLCFSTVDINDPQMLAFAVIPSGIITLIYNVSVMPDITLAIRYRNTIGEPGRTNDNYTSSVRRPLITIDSILHFREHHRLTAACHW